MIGKIININMIGPVLFRKSQRARNLNITIRPFKGVIVSVPLQMSYLLAEKIVVERTGWILEALEKVKKVETKKTIYDERTQFRTKEHTLVIRRIDSSDKNNILINLREDKIIVSIAKTIDIQSDFAQSAIHKGISMALRKEARKYIPQRVELLANKYGFSYNKITLKDIHSRWGSCSIRNNINLSIHLMKLPFHLIDYVILHELVHTIHKNHGKTFWNKLISVLPDAIKFDRELKQYRIKVY